ncbi:MAG: hypothetical protein OEW75_07005 [Cyclobacteriaceae bacterium]|nr:hypothetical protein [Cyclobacteriaceae bacterium]
MKYLVILLISGSLLLFANKGSYKDAFYGELSKPYIIEIIREYISEFKVDPREEIVECHITNTNGKNIYIISKIRKFYGHNFDIPEYYTIIDGVYVFITGGIYAEIKEKDKTLEFYTELLKENVPGIMDDVFDRGRTIDWFVEDCRDSNFEPVLNIEKDRNTSRSMTGPPCGFDVVPHFERDTTIYEIIKREQK